MVNSNEKYHIILEAAKDKINKLEKMVGGGLNNHMKNLITRNENLFDWNKVFNSEDALSEFNNQIDTKIQQEVGKSNPSIKPFTEEARSYLDNNNYDKAFSYQFISDFNKKYKTTRTAVPEFKSYVVGDLISQLNNKENYGNLVKLYLEVEKSQLLSGEGDKETDTKNTWIVIPSEESDPENYEKNVERLMSFSSCKTGWCVRGSGYAKRYLEYSNFHLYLDGDGDAVVSLRIDSDGAIDEISGTEDGSSQLVSEYYQDVTIEYVNKNGYTLDGFESENYGIREQELKELLEGKHNYDDYLKYTDGDEHFEIYDSGVGTDDFISEYLDRDKIETTVMESEGLDDVDEVDSDMIGEYLDTNYDFNYTNVYSRMYEDSANSQIYEALVDKGEELMGSGLIEFSDPEDKQGILWRKVKSKEVKETGSPIEKFFELGQPQIQNDGYGEDPLDNFIENEMSDIDEPYYGWGEYDSDILNSIIYEEYPEIIKNYGDSYALKKMEELTKKWEEERKEREEARNNLKTESSPFHKLLDNINFLEESIEVGFEKLKKVLLK